MFCKTWKHFASSLQPTRYLSRYRRISRTPIWELRLCMDQINHLSCDLEALAALHSRLVGDIERCRRNPLCLSPVYPEGFRGITIEDKHAQLLHSKLVGLKLEEMVGELEDEYRVVWELYDCTRSSVFRRVQMDDDKVDAAVEVVKGWVGGGRIASVKVLVKEANEWLG